MAPPQKVNQHSIDQHFDFASEIQMLQIIVFFFHQPLDQKTLWKQLTKLMWTKLRVVLPRVSSKKWIEGLVSKETVVLRRWEYYEIIWFDQLR